MFLELALLKNSEKLESNLCNGFQADKSIPSIKNGFLVQVSRDCLLCWGRAGAMDRGRAGAMDRGGAGASARAQVPGLPALFVVPTSDSSFCNMLCIESSP